MIDLYILRHGEAGPFQINDAARDLTPKGILQIENIRNELPDTIQVMAVSPYVRAQQTADLVAKHVSVAKRIQSETLTPETKPEDAIHWLEHSDATSVLLVSHNPFVSKLACSLCSESHISFGTGSLVYLQGDIIAPGCMSLKWFRNPS